MSKKLDICNLNVYNNNANGGVDLNELKAFLNCYKEHKIRYSLVIISIIIYVFSECEIKNIKEFICCIIINWKNLYQGVGVHAAALWAMYQYDKDKKMKRQEKSRKISNDFSNEFVEKLGIISYILSNSKKYTEFLKKVDFSLLNNFTIEEIQRMPELKDFNKEILKDKDLIKELNNNYKNYLEKNFTPEKISTYPLNFYTLAFDTFNSLEDDCMDLTNEAADNAYIYPSLHQLLLDTIEISCFLIAFNNDETIIGRVDKYYINLIEIYKQWRDIRNKDIIKQKKLDEKIIKIKKKYEAKKKNKIEKQKNKIAKI